MDGRVTTGRGGAGMLRGIPGDLDGWLLLGSRPSVAQLVGWVVGDRVATGLGEVGIVRSIPGDSGGWLRLGAGRSGVQPFARCG